MIAVLILLSVLYALTFVATARRHGRMDDALSALPASADSLGLSYSDADPQEEVVGAFLSIDRTRHDPYFEEDAFIGTLTGRFRDVEVVGFVYWMDIDGVLGYKFVASCQLPDRYPTVVACPVGSPVGVSLPAVPISDAQFSAQVAVYSSDAEFAQEMFGGDATVCHEETSSGWGPHGPAIPIRRRG